MVSGFLASDAVRREDGQTPSMPVEDAQGRLLLLTLGITQIIEQESIDISIHGSVDGETWIEKPLAMFPQKFYCGTYAILCDLSEHADVKFIRAQWKMSRWGRGEPKPLFGFYIFAEQSGVRVAAKAG
jgi:hypothetical protein